MEVNEPQNITDPKQIPNELKDFNWAAFLLTFIWGIRYRAWITFLAIPLFIIQMPLGLNWILLAILQLYCGMKGNEWAFRHEFWRKPKDFRITQMKWAAVALSIYIILPLILLNICQRFFKEPDNLVEIIQNAQCIVAQKNLKNDIQRISYNTSSSNSNIIKQFAIIYNEKYENSSITITNSKNPKFAEHYTIQVSKDETSQCTLVKKNCTITYTFSLPEYYAYTNQCGFYFDNYKHIIPNENTKKYIDKGVNVFKYMK